MDDSRVCKRDESFTVATRDQAAARSLLGKMVGSYSVARVLARGGMGEVYEARHPSIGRQVAIKVLTPEASQNPMLVDRFFAEARSVNLIRHDHIIEVLDLAFLPDGRPYLVMEYLEGESLEARVRRSGPLPLGDLGNIVLPVLDALDAAHAVGIVHRHLKPGNVFLSRRSGRLVPKVLDFGIAKLTDPDARTGLAGPGTSTGSVMGTPAYMAPEQAAGRVREIDARSDVYSVGVILYRMCCGRVPFRAEGHGDLLLAIMTTTPPSPRSFRPDLPQGVEAVLLRALAKRRGDRWQSAGAMAAALREALLKAGVPAADLPVVSPRGNVESASALARQSGEGPPTLDGDSLLLTTPTSSPPSSAASGTLTRTAAERMGPSSQAPPAARPWLWMATGAALLAVLTAGSVAGWLFLQGDFPDRAEPSVAADRAPAEVREPPDPPEPPEPPEQVAESAPASAPEPSKLSASAGAETAVPETAAPETAAPASVEPLVAKKRVVPKRVAHPAARVETVTAAGPLSPEEADALLAKKRAKKPAAPRAH